MTHRILYFMNVSNPDRLTSDSGWKFADILAPALLRGGAAVTFAGPGPLSDPEANFVAVDAPRSKYRARFSYDVQAQADVVRSVQPDVVVANQMETAAGLRAAMVEAGSDATLAGYCHYLPFYVDGDRLCIDPSLDDAGLGRSVLLHFFSGLMACDRVMVHSATARDWITQAARQMSMPLGDRVRVVPPPRDPVLVRDVVEPDGDGAVALYNHRLYEHYGTGRFVDLARRLVGTGEVRVRVMDLFGSRRRARVSLDASPERYRARLAAMPGVEVVSDGGDRHRYRSFVAGSTFGVAPFRPGCPWSMSVIDCQAMGVPVIAPRLAWMAEHIDAELLFDSVDEAIEIARRLTADRGFWTEHSQRARRSTLALAPERVASAYLEAIA